MHGASTVIQEYVQMCNQYGGNLPGAKGCPDEMLHEASQRGVSKINVDTDLRLAMTGGIRKVFAENPEVFDPRKYMGPGRDLIKRRIMKQENSIIAKNPTAYHNYEILDKYEAGIVLFGTEIKSIRQGKVNLKDSYASIDKNGEVFVHSMHISPYEQGNVYNKDPLRKRKLLLNKNEILKLHNFTTMKGFSLVPIDLHFKGNKVKILLGVGRGKKLFDKREDLKKKEDQRKIERFMKN